MFLRFANEVARRVEAQAPAVTLAVLACDQTEAPPRVTRPRANVLVQIAPIHACVGHALGTCEGNRAAADHVRGWAAVAPDLWAWHYITNLGHREQPFPDFADLTTVVPFYYLNGVRGICFQDGGQEFQPLRAWVLAQQLWDPRRDAAVLMRQFCYDYYGAGGRAVLAYIEWLRGLVQPLTPHQAVGVYDGPEAGYLNDAALLQGRALLAQAEAAVAADPVARRHVQALVLSVE